VDFSPNDEVTWAVKPEPHPEATLFVGKNRAVTQDEFYPEEAEHAMPFINEYASLGFPKDRIVRLPEDSDLPERYPLGYPAYQIER